MKVKKTKSPLREWVESIVGAVILTAFIIVFIAQSFVVEGTSMLPTLEHNQRLLVDKHLPVPPTKAWGYRRL